MKKYTAYLTTIITACAIITACSGGNNSDSSDYPRFTSDDNTIVQYVFPSSLNSSLSGNAAGTIADNTISVTVPHDADLTGLISEFVSNSTQIEANGASQISGVTSNNFTDPVQYIVTAENGDTRTYTVTVTRAPSTEKSLTAFSVNGNNGIIDQETGVISVELPPLTVVTALIASFSTTGVSVSVEGINQISGTTPRNFTNPVTYTVTAQDGTTRDYIATVTVRPAPYKDITSFAFYRDLNPTLVADTAGIISGNAISVELPFGSSTENLIASFNTTGISVKVNDIEQVSGTTVNTFSDAVTYAVKAEDQTSKNYTVTVTVAKNDAKAITSFSLNGEPGTINEEAGTIIVELPVDAVVTALTASFTTTGVSVKIGSTIQESGETQNDFSSPLNYDVAAENGTVKTYTVTANRNEEITGLWNFETGADESYEVFEATTTEGLFGNALTFDGYNDYVRVPDSGTLTMANAGTIEALIYINEHTPFAGIVHKGVLADFSDEAFSLQFWTPDGLLRIGIFGESGAYAYVDSSYILETDRWYYLAATWDGSELRLYINRTLDGSTLYSFGALRDSSGDLVIGAQLPDVYINSTWRNLGFSGIIDRVQFHGRALSSEEIESRFDELANESGGALAASLIAAVKTRMDIIAVILVIILAALAGLYVKNKRLAKKM